MLSIASHDEICLDEYAQEVKKIPTAYVKDYFCDMDEEECKKAECYCIEKWSKK